MERKVSFYEKYIKRVLDILCSLAAIILFCWLFAIVALLVRIKLGSPVIFKQPRPGKDGKVFMLHKFRSMTDETDDKGELLPDEMRLTRFGRFLRSTSLDELPELWDILIGNMSIIGPRPLLVKYLPLYNDEQRRRHEVRPGLTGWAQINGRDELPIDVKARFDGEYVEKISFLFDCQCFFGTIASVLKSDGVVEGGTGQLEKEKKGK